MPLRPLQSVRFFELLRRGAIPPWNEGVQVHLRYAAPFDVAALAAAWHRAIRGHPVLGTALAWGDGAEPSWQHDPDAALPVEVVDGSSLDPVERAAHWREFFPSDQPHDQRPTGAVTELHVAGGHMEFLVGDERVAVSRAITLGMEQAFDTAVSIAQR